MRLRLAAAVLAISSALVAQNDAVKQKFLADLAAALALQQGSVVADIGAGDNPTNALTARV